MPERPIDAYKLIIDELVENSPALSSRLVREDGVFSKAAGTQEMNDLVRALTPAQRTTLARMLTHERQAAFHDVLATLTWWLDSGHVGITYRGHPMPVQLSGMGLHGDYVGRLDDWNWPEDEDGA
jgi:hypothetical protein